MFSNDSPLLPGHQCPVVPPYGITHGSATTGGEWLSTTTVPCTANGTLPNGTTHDGVAGVATVNNSKIVLPKIHSKDGNMTSRPQTEAETKTVGEDVHTNFFPYIITENYRCTTSYSREDSCKVSVKLAQNCRRRSAHKTFFPIYSI